MKISGKDEFKNNAVLGHIVLHCLENSAINQLVNSEQYRKDGILDIKITINGHNADIMKLVNLWQSQVNDMILDEAQKILREKFSKAKDLLDDFNSQLSEKIDIMKED